MTIQSSNKYYHGDRCVLKISELAPGQSPLPESDPDLAHYQSILNERAIALNCENPAQPKQLNAKNIQAIEEYLEHLQRKNDPGYENVKDLLERGLDSITLEELQVNLATTTRFLDSKLKGDYEIGFIEKKSSKWIAELALRHMKRLPSHSFQHVAERDGRQTALQKESRRFVIFEDASYSGKQLYSTIMGLHRQLDAQEKQGKLYCVVPFVSTVAKEFLATRLTRQPALNLKVHLITSTRQPKALRDVYPDNWSTHGVTFTEWKVPDEDSLPSFIRSGILPDASGKSKKVSFITEYPCCYK